MPSFIEVLLNQKIQNYNTENNFYYSENQYTPLDSFTPIKSIPIFEKYENLKDENKQAIMNVAIRMLLIPSKDIKLISGKDLNDSTQYDQLDYSNLALEFNNTFHKKAIQKLEERLKVLLRSNDQIDRNKQQPKNIIDLILETKVDKPGSKPYLHNINFKEGYNNLIFKVYEFIMIMLKIKYYKFMSKNLELRNQPVKGGSIYIDRRFIGNSMLTFNSIKKISQKKLLNNSMNTHITTIPKLKTKKTRHSKTKDVKELKESNPISNKSKNQSKGHMKKQSRHKNHKQQKLSKKKN